VFREIRSWKDRRFFSGCLSFGLWILVNSASLHSNASGH
jgi:hypothetical protein